MAKRLDADERQRRSLLADVSHELRTPLSVVQGNLEALLDGVHPPDEAHLASILDETRVLSNKLQGSTPSSSSDRCRSAESR